MIAQYQADNLAKALADLNEQMKGHSQYDITYTTRGFLELNIIEGRGAKRRVLWLGNDIDKATAAIATVTEWEESR